jgi:hypothetical protein
VNHMLVICSTCGRYWRAMVPSLRCLQIKEISSIVKLSICTHMKVARQTVLNLNELCSKGLLKAVSTVLLLRKWLWATVVDSVDDSLLIVL